MLWFFLVPIALAIWIYHAQPTDLFEFVIAGLVSLLGLLIAGAFASLVMGSWVDSMVIWNWEKADQSRMVSVQEKDGITGHTFGLFLSAGYVESEPYYFYYVKDNDGAIIPARVRITEDIKIYEEPRADGFLVRQHQRCSRWWCNWIALPGDGGWRWEFHVPQGTVQRQFKM